MAKEKLDRSRQKDTFIKVLKYMKPYWFYLALSLLLAAVTVALTLYLPKLTGFAVDRIIEQGRVDFAGILQILKLMAATILITAAAQWIMNICNNKMTYEIVRDIRNEAFRKIEILPLKYVDAHSYGEITSRVIADVDQFADGLLMGFTQLFTGVMTILGTLLFMLTTDLGITLVVVLITPLSFFVAAFIAKRTFTMFRVQSETRGEQTALIDEMIGNQKVVQAFGYEKKAEERFDEINERLRSCSLRAIFYSSITNPATRFVNNVVYAGVGLVGALSAVMGRISVGDLSCLLSYANQYTKPFNEISGVVTELQNALACAARIFELIEEEPQTPEKENAAVLSERVGGVQGNVELSHVYFSYTKEQKLIEDFNLRVRPGQRIAIVGPTGCGKTTLINLLMRFYDVTGGEIRVEGCDVRDVTRKSLRASFGMVLQDTWLKAGTIRDNIVMGKPDATEEEIVAAAKASHAHSFIKRLPNGYDTVITEEGGGLSQGQKQLLCITRVMLCLPPMLILDEATSSIDTRTEMRIQEAFARMMKGRTSFIVAHRLSTIREADVILVMRDGHIVEQGRHEELLEKNGFYAGLYNSQFAL
ncbi:MAG TPA: ABC transporter ATP-binding protein/permease [Candidatus Eisenbergiella merdavium]|uniref:ABC transporter ATP-binding protein/permease n=1 Tax=Candidatus Eisenbergiella merdavium TaxID=2838551 RepID=A0A9D2NF32_9FIRM|nr:ABC transporter ATP-binding protein/permease [Candidatus Eisenbergiella merdavium]